MTTTNGAVDVLGTFWVIFFLVFCIFCIFVFFCFLIFFFKFLFRFDFGVSFRSCFVFCFYMIWRPQVVVFSSSEHYGLYIFLISIFFFSFSSFLVFVFLLSFFDASTELCEKYLSTEKRLVFWWHIQCFRNISQLMLSGSLHMIGLLGHLVERPLAITKEYVLRSIYTSRFLYFSYSHRDFVWDHGFLYFINNIFTLQKYFAEEILEQRTLILQRRSIVNFETMKR